MQAVTRCASALVVVTLFAGAVRLAAQEPAPEPSQQTFSADGELRGVDLDRRILWIAAADDSQLQFRFTDDTEVVGANDRVEGLATMRGAEVTVDYRREGTASIATRIAVLPDSGEEPAR